MHNAHVNPEGGGAQVDDVVDTKALEFTGDGEGEGGDEFGGGSTGQWVFGECEGVVGDSQAFSAGLVAEGVNFGEHRRSQVAINLTSHFVSGGVVVNGGASFTTKGCEDFVESFMGCMSASEAGWA